MDPRSLGSEIPGTGIFHPTLMHPIWGTPLEAWFVDAKGRVHWPVLGGADDDTGAGDDGDGGDDDKDGDKDDDDDDDSDDDDDDSDDDDDDDDDSKGKKKKPTLKSAQAKIKALEEEKDRHYRIAKKAKKEKADLEARLKAIEDKGMKPEEKAERDKKEQAEKDNKATAALRQVQLENAFLKANEIDWIDKEDALRLVDWDDVEVDDDGTVDRKTLRVALRRLAKAKPHLVKKAAKQSDAGDDDDSADEDDKGSKSSSSAMNGKRKKGDKTPTRDQLAARFPVLGRR